MSKPFNPPRIIYPKRSREQKLLEMAFAYGMKPETFRQKIVAQNPDFEWPFLVPKKWLDKTRAEMRDYERRVRGDFPQTDLNLKNKI